MLDTPAERNNIVSFSTKWTGMKLDGPCSL